MKLKWAKMKANHKSSPLKAQTTLFANIETKIRSIKYEIGRVIKATMKKISMLLWQIFFLL